MTLLDEAIQRENKIAEENQKIVDTQIVFDDVSISELYCDDTEVIEEHLSNYKKCAEYHKQIAEWLEDYKRIKEEIGTDWWLKEHDRLIRNKAIDDFVNDLKDYFVIPHDVGVIEMKAEQLKAGVTND